MTASSSSPYTPPGVPILENSAWSDSNCSWDDSTLSGELTVDGRGFIAPKLRQEVSSERILQWWLQLRWSLSRFQAANCDVKRSGIPPSIALAVVFASVVRNNSLLVVFTGISFERALFYHKLFAFVTIILTALHGLAYIFAKRDERFQQDSPKFTMGMIAFLAMVVLYLLSIGYIRRRYHEFFVKTHWILFIVILITAVLHGGVIALVGVIPWEIDMVYRLIYRSRIYSHGSLCGVKSQPLTNSVYSIEKPTQRLGVAAPDRIQIFQLPGDITCIQFPRIRLDTGEEFKYKAGQYAFLCIPTISPLEWHPFSFSSSPHEDFVSFHIKAVGDWTVKLLQAAPETQSHGDPPFEVMIDGPYGNLSIDIEDSAIYSHFVVFAGEMGVTSMRSITNYLHSQRFLEKARIIHRLRFIWAVSDSESLHALMKSDTDRWRSDVKASYLPEVLLCPTTLNVSTETFFTEIYLTRGLVGSQISVDPQFGKCLWFHRRPDIERILREMGQQAEKHGNSRVAVLVCGPESMTMDVITTCILLSSEMKLHFDVHNEKFAL
ncbi:hypothetical protein DVH05_010046 [Phytophthora capsici]|nr:hypothetical protein DVH05_010046 [Phytophthora capsici]